MAEATDISGGWGLWSREKVSLVGVKVTWQQSRKNKAGAPVWSQTSLRPSLFRAELNANLNLVSDGGGVSGLCRRGNNSLE